MAKTKISILFGEQVDDMFHTRVRDGHITLHTDVLIRNGWRVRSTMINGSLTVEKDGTVYLLGEHHVEEEDS